MITTVIRSEQAYAPIHAIQQHLAHDINRSLALESVTAAKSTG
jgi:hypothetical protein